MPLPEAFENRLKRDLPLEFEELITAIEGEPKISIRLNPAKPTALGVALTEQVKWNENGRYLAERPKFTLDPLLHAGAYYVQEASSMFIHEVLKQIKPNIPITVLDLCAAPGGKSSLMAAALSDDDLLVCNEVIKSRVTMLKENLTKWGFKNILYTNHDPEDFADLEGFFDIVLVDAPCSGEGLFRKDKEASKEWSEDSVKMCAMRQQRILTAAAYMVKPSGHLIYSTCTYNDAENEDNVAWLKRTFELEPVKLHLEKSWGIVEQAYGYQFYPHKVNGEGFYLAVLKQNGKEQHYPKARIDLLRVNRQTMEYIEPWINPDLVEDFEFYQKKDGVIIALRSSLLPEYGTLFKALFKRSWGFELGILKGQDLIPSPSLAFSDLLNPHIESLELDKGDALQYLKKENFDPKTDKEGWILMKYQGLGLGFIKKMQDRTNNYYPSEWRIRMEIS